MFCPKCASAVVAGQRFCRNCGLKLDVIVDAIEGKSRAPFDFDPFLATPIDLADFVIMHCYRSLMKARREYETNET